MSHCTVKTVNVDNLSTEGGEAIGYLKSNEMEKIHVALLGETGKSFFDFYYSRSKLAFVLEKRYQYNRPFYWSEEASEEYGDTEVFDKAKTQILENRYYFKNDKIILWLDENQKLTPTASTNSESKAKDLAELSNELKENISQY